MRRIKPLTKAALLCRLGLEKIKVRKLKAEINLLKSRISRLENETKQRERINSQNEKRALTIDSFKSFFSYKSAIIKSTNVWNAAEKIFVYSRRSLFAASIFRYAAVVIAFIETSAVLVIFSSALLILVPTLILGVVALMILDLMSGKKYDRIIADAVKGKKAVILSAHRCYKNSRFLKGFVRELAKKGYTVIVITKSLKDGTFPTAKVTDPHIILIREAYFFRLRHILKDSGCTGIIMVH